MDTHLLDPHFGPNDLWNIRTSYIYTTKYSLLLTAKKRQETNVLIKSKIKQ